MRRSTPRATPSTRASEPRPRTAWAPVSTTCVSSTTTSTGDQETKRNVGVDLGFFDNQIELTADYFNNRRKSILLERNTIPGVAGFHAKPWQNYGIVDNWGVDASLNARHDFGKVRVSARGTFTFARNKIIEYDELKQLYDYQRITGTRVNENTLYIAERLYTEDDFIRTQNPNGTYSYELRPGLPTVALQGTLGPATSSTPT